MGTVLLKAKTRLLNSISQQMCLLLASLVEVLPTCWNGVPIPAFGVISIEFTQLSMLHKVYLGVSINPTSQLYLIRVLSSVAKNEDSTYYNTL